MKVCYLIGNLKMNKTREEIIPYLKKLDKLSKKTGNIVGVCLPSIHIGLAEKLRYTCYGTQNVYFEEKGAYTGELSVAMLESYGCHLCLVGHSERRQLFGETDDSVNKKVKAIVAGPVTPIICVGETLKEREAGQTKKIIKNQIEKAVKGLSLEDVEKCWFAYEPVWAIGSGKSATSEDAENVISYIKQIIIKKYPEIKDRRIVVLYGGSLNEKNCRELLSQPSIDGGLIGGACLDIRKFEKIINTKIEEDCMKDKKVKLCKNEKCGKKTVKKLITKDMTIGDVLAIKPEAAAVFMGFGMHCFSCPISSMETLEEAAQVHGADLDLMLQKLNEL